MCERTQKGTLNLPGLKEQQLQEMKTQPGLIAALDQSGGSTPKALLNHGIKPDAWSNVSGGYSRVEGNDRLRRNRGVVASFSRALVEGLSVQQSDAEYNALLDAAIQSIFEASNN
jgi:fructose-bisphosphate aldolase class 1